MIDPLQELKLTIHKDRYSCYGVTVESLPGCYSYGETLEEAIQNTIEAIKCHLEGTNRDLESILDSQWSS